VRRVRAAAKKLVLVCIPAARLDAPGACPWGLPHYFRGCRTGRFRSHFTVALTAKVVDIWLPGEMGGIALGDVLLGRYPPEGAAETIRYNPAGRSAVTWYRSADDLPDIADMSMYTKNGRTYRFFNGSVVFPFGHGLSYSTYMTSTALLTIRFTYSNLRLSSAVSACDDIEARVDVRNSGSVAGDEVVQAYVTLESSSVPSARIRLADFARVHLEVGQSREVILRIRPEQRSVVLDDGSGIVEATQVSVFVGGGQPQYYEGYVSGKVHIMARSLLDDCY
jgi:beta-glucosidase